MRKNIRLTILVIITIIISRNLNIQLMKAKPLLIKMMFLNLNSKDNQQASLMLNLSRLSLSRNRQEINMKFKLDKSFKKFGHSRMKVQNNGLMIQGQSLQMDFRSENFPKIQSGQLNQDRKSLYNLTFQPLKSLATIAHSIN